MIVGGLLLRWFSRARAGEAFDGGTQTAEFLQNLSLRLLCVSEMAVMAHDDFPDDIEFGAHQVRGAVQGHRGSALRIAMVAACDGRAARLGFPFLPSPRRALPQGSGEFLVIFHAAQSTPRLLPIR